MNITLYIQETMERKETHFRVRPLFGGGPERRGELLSRAMARLLPELRRHVETLVRENRHEALAHAAFCPDAETLQFDETLTLRKQSLACRFLVVCFRAFEWRIAFSPSVPNVWFEIAKGQRLQQRAVDAYTEHFRVVERDVNGQEIPVPEPGFVRAWVTTHELDVSLSRPPRDKEDNKFLAIFGPKKMNGRDELEKVGRRLESLYPDDLDRAVLREMEVATLASRLTAVEPPPDSSGGPAPPAKRRSSTNMCTINWSATHATPSSRKIFGCWPRNA